MKQIHSTAYFFDIDGVFLHGANAIVKGGENIAAEAYKMVREKNLPHIFLTNSSGLPEKKSTKLNEVLKLNSDQKIEPDHIIMAQTPCQKFFEKGGELDGKYCLLIGGEHDGGIPGLSSNIGCKNYYTVKNLQDLYPELDWMDRKNWENKSTSTILNSGEVISRTNFKQIDAVVILGEPLHWEGNLQLILDTLLCSGFPNRKPKNYPKIDKKIPIYAVNMDLTWKAKANTPRFGNGAFLLCLESLYEKITGEKLVYEKLVGKPSRFTYEFALEKLKELYPEAEISKVLGVGDNLKSDIAGANNMKVDGRVDYESVLVLTGVDSLEGARKKENFNHSHRDFLNDVTSPDRVMDDILELVRGI